MAYIKFLVASLLVTNSPCTQQGFSATGNGYIGKLW